MNKNNNNKKLLSFLIYFLTITNSHSIYSLNSCLNDTILNNYINKCNSTTTTTNSTIDDECSFINCIQVCKIKKNFNCIYSKCDRDITLNSTIGQYLLSESGFDYRGKSQCLWLITYNKPQQQQMSQPPSDNNFYSTASGQDEHVNFYMNFNRFSMRFGFDFVYIFNGTTLDSQLIGGFTGYLESNITVRMKSLRNLIILFQKSFILNINKTVVSELDMGFDMEASKLTLNADLASLDPRLSLTSIVQTNKNCSTSQLCKITFLNSENINDFYVKRAFHRSVFVDNQYLYVTGGYSYDLEKIDFPFMIRFDLTTRIWSKLEDGNIPAHRYGHTLVHFKEKNKLFMFGGMLLTTLSNDESHNFLKELTNELWSFDLSTQTWSQVEIKNNASHRKPIAVCGHSSILFKDTIITFFGYSYFYRQLSMVQEYNITSNQWTLFSVSQNVSIYYTHTSVFNPQTQRIYLHGGMNLSETYFNTKSPLISNKLFEYNPITREFRKLKSSNMASYFHSSFIFNNYMFVHGGNVIEKRHKQDSKTLFRMTNRIRIYDINANKWLFDDDETYFKLFSITRYSHSTFLLENESKLCFFAGFFGSFYDSIFCVPLNDCFFNCTEKDTSLPNVTSVVFKSYEIMSKDNCASYNDCNECLINDKCIWVDNNCLPFEIYQIKNDDNTVEFLRQRKACVKACSTFTNCLNCTNNNDVCVWCDSKKQCVQKDAFNVFFPFGQCMNFINDNPLCEITNCNYYKNCSECTTDEKCSWCGLDDGITTGYGTCVQINGNKTNSSLCPSSQWYDITCPLCQCNGHGNCINENSSVCVGCGDNTAGEACSRCADGYWGDATNGGYCMKCDCNSQSNYCDPKDGKCYCSTKGVSGSSCQLCDQRYHGNPSAKDGTCYYDLSTDYQFTFNLNKETDRYYTRINFSNKPAKFDADIDFTITCYRQNALINVTYILWSDEDCSRYMEKMTNNTNLTFKLNDDFINENYKNVNYIRANEIQVLTEINCSQTQFKHTFLVDSAKIDGTIKNRTYYVYVYNFRTPISIEISFTHHTRIQLLHFFITFFGCFITLLSIAFVFWKLKQRYDRYQRQRRAFMEMKQMASRPFAKLLVDIDEDNNQQVQQQQPHEFIVDDIQNAQYQDDRRKYLIKRKLNSNNNQLTSIVPVAVEPLASNKAAICTVLLKLPTGGLDHTPEGSSPFIFGSTLISINQTDLAHMNSSSSNNSKPVKSDKKKTDDLNEDEFDDINNEDQAKYEATV